ncbi:CMP-N-acetylneuraminate-poly-alpha-2,8-sialyltransferase-like [Apostichopus japonicus]|uniref:CMP-N-acetylneuraminate-poly-alpha-2, 8-sialyltransferase-like n=1 Tax=Stichopus japonicus TaxID=307972 RepID=UPI003AB70CAF
MVAYAICINIIRLLVEYKMNRWLRKLCHGILPIFGVIAFALWIFLFSTSDRECYVFRSCDVLCDKSYKNCFEKDYTLVVFQTPLTGEEVFRQMDHCSNNFIEKFLLPHPSNSQPKILPCPISDFDPLYATLTRHKKCALVGNSGILLQSKCGRTIDSFDFVIRGNMAPVIEYESYVGTKTDMMLLNDVMINVLAEVLSRGPRDDREIEIMKTLKHFRNTILWYPKNTEKHISQLKSIVRGLKKNNFSIHIAYSLIDIYRNIKWKYNMWRYPSSGLYMLALAESICEEITLFGFYPFERDPFDKEIRSHYYDKSFTRYKSWAHNFETEHGILESRHSQGLLHLKYQC